MAESRGPTGSRVTWRLVVPSHWGQRGDPSWLPAVGGEGWRKVFAGEDAAGLTLRDGADQLPWRVAASASGLLASVLEHYRVQLRVAEDVAATCTLAESHLAALRAAGAGVEPPTRSHPAGRWRVCARDEGATALVADHPSVDGAEGDVAARRAGDPRLVCWAEPDSGPPPGPARNAPGWQPRVDQATRHTAFAVEDAIASLCAAPELGLTGPDVLDGPLLGMLGDASWRCIREYRTLMAGIWTDLERCPHTEAHEADATAALKAYEEAYTAVRARNWRHLQILHGEVVERSVHVSQRNAAASVAVARAVDDVGLHWCAPLD